MKALMISTLLLFSFGANAAPANIDTEGNYCTVKQADSCEELETCFYVAVKGIYMEAFVDGANKKTDLDGRAPIEFTLQEAYRTIKSLDARGQCNGTDALQQLNKLAQ